QDKATKPQTVQIVRQGEATPYWFKFNPLCTPVQTDFDNTCGARPILRNTPPFRRHRVGNAV
ncbi:TPA: hypothetical protein ACJJH3_000922, partial [Neisseria meningitidis]